MVYHAGGYYGNSFKGVPGVTQGDPVLSTNVNAVVDTLVCHWTSLVAVEEAGPDIWGRYIQWRAALFYADDGLITSTWTEWIQGSFDALTGLFD